MDRSVDACHSARCPLLGNPSSRPLPDQHRIVAEVERRLSLTGALAAATAAALKRSAALRRQVLERAFTGKLAPQDPADEPASALLERIKAERETQAKPGKRRGRAIKPTSDL
jgi:type I restriction enzyme S subunit